MPPGLNADADALHFGTLSPGGSSQRRMTIVAAHDARLVIEMEGNLSPFVAPERNDFRVTAGEPVRLRFQASVPAGAPEGWYEGRARFSFYRR